MNNYNLDEFRVRETGAIQFPNFSFLFRRKKKPEEKIITCSECGKKSDKSKWEESIPAWEEEKGFICPRCGYIETKID